MSSPKSPSHRRRPRTRLSDSRLKVIIAAAIVLSMLVSGTVLILAGQVTAGTNLITSVTTAVSMWLGLANRSSRGGTGPS